MGAGYARLAHESVPGNESNSPTLSTKKLFPRLISFESEPGFGHLERDDELVNTDEPISVLSETADPTWRLRTRMYPDTIGMLLTCALGLPVTTQGNASSVLDPDSVPLPATAYRHVWTAPFGPAGASPMTFQADLAYSSPEAVYFKAKGCATTELSIESPERGGCSVNANGAACYLDRQSDPSLSPTYEAETIPPFFRKDLLLPAWLSGTATPLEFSFRIEIPYEVRHSAGSGSRWPDIVYKGDRPIMVRGSVPKHLIDSDDFDALKAATGFAATARWTNTAIIGSGYPYKMFLQLSNAQYDSGAPEALDNTRLRGGTFNFRSSRVGSASVVLTVVNSTASYA